MLFRSENGQLKQEVAFKDDKQDGPDKMYYESGKLEGEWIFKDGKHEGKSKIFRENGSIAYIDIYKNGVKVNRKAYDEEGKLKFEQNY